MSYGQEESEHDEFGNHNSSVIVSWREGTRMTTERTALGFQRYRTRGGLAIIICYLQGTSRESGDVDRGGESTKVHTYRNLIMQRRGKYDSASTLVLE